MSRRSRKGGGSVFWDEDRGCHTGQLSHHDAAGIRKRPKVYEALKEKGMSKEKAAKISNAGTSHAKREKMADKAATAAKSEAKMAEKAASGAKSEAKTAKKAAKKKVAKKPAKKAVTAKPVKKTAPPKTTKKPVKNRAWAEKDGDSATGPRLVKG